MKTERATVLLVEDDHATREMFYYALRIEGFEVLVAQDGLAALRLLDEHVPDVVVLDLDLPQFSGFDVQQEIVAHVDTAAIPVVVVTATEWEVPTSVFQTLRKPITPDVLVNVVVKAMRDPGGSSRPEPRRTPR
jgi:DNA-binding response OmpR family regulator